MSLAPLPAIDTARLRLRRVERADLPELLAINGDEAVTHHLPYATWRSIADADAWYERMARLVESGAATEQFVIVQRASARVIGTCLLFRLDAASARAEIGYVLGREWWGQGLAVEALRAFVAASIEHYQLRRLEADIDPLNLASARLLERLGFEREGLLRQRYFSKGRRVDAALYGLLSTDAR
jgi:[ribosomal protein S5]-alanine N-acetyltransferase